MSAEEFGEGRGIPFAPGDVLGLRIWTIVIRPARWVVDGAGVTVHRGEQVGLKSVYREYFWRPDENVADCLPSPGNWGKSPGRNAAVKDEECVASHEHGPENPTRQETCYRPHHPTGIDPQHGCGFYAYTSDTRNCYLQTNQTQIEGVVQGYGIVTVGSKGFRAERARILALTWTPPAESEATNAVKRATLDRFDPQHLAYLFGVPLYESREAMVEEFPLGLRSAAWTL